MCQTCAQQHQNPKRKLIWRLKLMDKPTMFEPYQAAVDIDVVPAYFPIPGLGILPVNAFVLKAAQPVLVDTTGVRQAIASIAGRLNPSERLAVIQTSHSAYNSRIYPCSGE